MGAPRVFSVVASSVAMCIDLAIYTDTLCRSELCGLSDLGLTLPCPFSIPSLSVSFKDRGCDNHRGEFHYKDTYA